MTLNDRIFPRSSPRPASLMQTQWIGTWESQFIGFGRLTAFLSDQLGRFSAADDDLGLGVVFLHRHRHRAELGLKLLLERAKATVRPYHRLDLLRRDCKHALATSGLSSEWARFCAEQDEYLALMQKLDPRGYTYRYPKDPRGTPVHREHFIDLGELEKAGTRFEAAVMLVVDVMARRSYPHVSSDQIEPMLQELAAALRAIRAWLQFNDATGAILARLGERLDVSSRSPTPDMVQAQSKSGVHADLLTRLQPSLLRLLDQIERRRPRGALPLDLEPGRLAAEPHTASGAPLVIAKWVATEIGRRARDIKLTLTAIHERSRLWTDPADHQIHIDIGRLLSRL